MDVIRVLHLEDDPRDAALVRDILDADGLACDVTVVAGREPFETELDRRRFDLIFCDFNLPDYDGFAALERSRQRQPDVPVLIISGSLREEDAVKCLHAGATDYLLKQRLDRLPSAVTRALGAAEEHRQRQDAERELERAKRQFESLAECSPSGIFSGNAEGQLTYANPRLAEITRRPVAALLGRRWMDAIHPEDRERVIAKTRKLMAERRPDQDEFRIVTPNGEVRHCRANVSVIATADGTPGAGAFVGTVMDVTEEKEALQRGLRAQRLEAVGTLAGGVAHDLNNALAPILMGIELIRINFPNESQMLDTMEISAKRGAKIVRQLLTFVRGAEGERVSIQPSHLVKETQKLVASTFPKNIAVELQWTPHLPAITGDPTQLHQVLLNLAVNARDAMPAGGTLTLEALELDLDAAAAASIADGRPGKYVVLRVSDTGTGIPPEIVDRIFEPFFTTKGPDVGTGLGLSTVLGIVKGHRGFLQLASEPGRGSTFSVYLPAITDSDQRPAAQVDVDYRGQGESILFVDDEAAIRSVARMVLRHLNYVPLTAASGAEALIQVAEHRTELRAIIADLQMPGMDGVTFIRTLRRVLPDIPVAVASGNITDAISKELDELGVRTRLHKPFSEAQLAEALRSLVEPGA